MDSQVALPFKTFSCLCPLICEYVPLVLGCVSSAAKLLLSLLRKSGIFGSHKGTNRRQIVYRKHYQSVPRSMLAAR